MRYHVLHIKTSFAEEWRKDVFDQQLFDLGVDTIDGGDYYIPSGLWQQNQTAIRNLLSTASPLQSGKGDGFPFSVSEVPDENWNAAWESEHPMEELPLGVKIVPHCAFGAGHHETTSMMIDALLKRSNDPMVNDQMVNDPMVNDPMVNVLDHGTGTGVLAIFAKKLGAKNVLAIDIDDKSVANAQENAVLNGVDIDIRLGDSIPSVLKGEPDRVFDLILANIHRNVLLANMASYSAHLSPGGELWLSGFYETDCPALIASAGEQGLLHTATHANGEWRMLQFAKAE
ncbi:MAG: 50S ribosomal protein L11 methyltransferase [Paludibacteraceae bacterium]|nr:50S ribosomal protein L11 methyltransferase [Paludibacteraceae bacterium]